MVVLMKGGKIILGILQKIPNLVLKELAVVESQNLPSMTSDNF
jgi:hypothetical protein